MGSKKGQYQRGKFQVPREVIALINKFGGKGAHGAMKNAAKAVAMNASHLGKLSGGVEKTTDRMLARIKAVLNNIEQREQHSVNGDQYSSPLAATPTLVIGAKTVQTKRGIRKSKYDKTDPPLIKELMAKFGGSRNAAGSAIGYSGAGKLNDISSGRAKMDEETEARIKAVLADQPVPRRQPKSATDDLDKYTLNIAIVVCNSEISFERVYEAGEIVDGDWVFKIHKGSMWIGFLRYDSVEKVRTFKRLFSRDAVIVCP